MKLHIICVAYQRSIQLESLINCFLIQTNSNWVLHIIHDGLPSQEILDVISRKTDQRVSFISTENINGKWGHPNRKMMLQSIKTNPDDFILITNDDNYYVPRFVGQFLESAKSNIGMIYCDCIHSYTDYSIHNSQIKEGWIDIGSFAVRADIAKQTGFNHEHISADGIYAEECLKNCQRVGLRTIHIQKYIFIHC